MKKVAFFGAVIAAVITFPSVVWAGAQATSDVACGYSTVKWNAPNGAVVATYSSHGIVTPVIQDIGEYRTHTMISHGTIGWLTHSTMHSPGTNGWPTYCSTPLKVDELARGYPGIAQVNMGAIYQYEYGGSETPEFIAYQSGGADGAAIADWLWSDSEWYSVQSLQSSSYYYRIKDNGNTMYYLLYEYMDLKNDALGDSQSYTPTTGTVFGTVCSTSVAWAAAKALGIHMNPKSYSNSSGMLNTAADDLHDGVESSCKDGLGFWTGIGAAITCFEGICDDAGRQVRNCMAFGKCDTDAYGDTLSSSELPYSTVARSISPDHLLGYTHSSGCFGSYLCDWRSTSYHNNCPSSWQNDSWCDIGCQWGQESSCAGRESEVGAGGPYVTNNYEQVDWNSSGQVYGCWF